MSLNKILLAALCTVFFSCKHANKVKDSAININKELMMNKLSDKPAIFFSCVRCGCMVTELNKIYNNDPQFFDKFTFYADTGCIKQISFKKLIVHSPQAFLDSVYDENYSVIVFKKMGNDIDTRLIKTEESEKMKSILTKY
jgi:hypothetical protein